MAIKKFYQNVRIAGLRSNPKLCVVQRDGKYVDIFCGLACGCCVPVKVENMTTYDEAVKLGIKKVISQHDKRMRTDKRNRIGTSLTRASAIESFRIRGAAGRASWLVPARGSQDRIRFTN